MDTLLLATEDFCRLCLQQNNPYISLFENNLNQMLESLTSIKINSDDSTPHIICLQCNTDLQLAYNIQQKFKSTELVLWEKMVNRIKIEKEVVHCEEEVKTEEIGDFNTLPSSENTEIKGEPSEDIEKSNTRKEILKITFTCFTCNEKFTDINDYKNHLPIHRKKTCKICLKSMTLVDFASHKNTHDGGNCEHCGKTMKNKKALHNHLYRYHSKPQVVCELCGLASLNLSAHDLHVRRIHTHEPLYICDLCGKSFYAVDVLKKHISEKHNKKKTACDVCKKQFASVRALKQHERVHSDNMFICQFCGRGFRYECNMNSHMKKMHNWMSDQKFKCPICHKWFPSNLSLGVHGTVHRK